MRVGWGEVVAGKWRQLYLNNNKKHRKKKDALNFSRLHFFPKDYFFGGERQIFNSIVSTSKHTQRYIFPMNYELLQDTWNLSHILRRKGTSVVPKGQWCASKAPHGTKRKKPSTCWGKLFPAQINNCHGIFHKSLSYCSIDLFYNREQPLLPIKRDV